MALTFYRDIERVDWAEAGEVFKRSLGPRDPEKLQRAFEQSFACVTVFDDDRLVGLARAISDGEYQAAIYDVVVLPEYQRRGIGRKLMEELMDQVKVDNIILYSVPGREEFYARCGFRRMTTAMAILHPWMADPSRGYIEPSVAKDVN